MNDTENMGDDSFEDFDVFESVNDCEIIDDPYEIDLLIDPDLENDLCAEEDIEDIPVENPLENNAVEDMRNEQSVKLSDSEFESIRDDYTAYIEDLAEDAARMDEIGNDRMAELDREEIEIVDQRLIDLYENQGKE